MSTPLPLKKNCAPSSLPTRAVPSSHSPFKKVVIDSKDSTIMQTAVNLGNNLPSHTRSHIIIKKQTDDPINPTKCGLKILKELLLSEQSCLDIDDVEESLYED